MYINDNELPSNNSSEPPEPTPWEVLKAPLGGGMMVLGLGAAAIEAASSHNLPSEIAADIVVRSFRALPGLVVAIGGLNWVRGKSFFSGTFE